ALLGVFLATSVAVAEGPVTEKSPVALPENARLALAEDWTSGRIDPDTWYVPRTRWSDDGNHGVAPENVGIEPDIVFSQNKNVLVCGAHGDEYDGSVVGFGGQKTRVGGMVVSKSFYASGRFEVVMKFGSTQAHDGGPKDPQYPRGAIPAIWTYGYRLVQV